MWWTPSHPTSGRSVRTDALAIVLLALVAACNYGFRGGGGFPGHVRTLYVEPFENRTDRFDLDQQLFRQLTEELPRSLGLRLGSEQTADVVVRGRIIRYDDQAQNYLPGQQTGSVQVIQHQVQITISVEIVDRTRNEILWESQGVSGRGEYRPDTQTDQVARVRALEHVVRQIIDGAQSQW
jgi:hypothetical protein